VIFNVVTKEEAKMAEEKHIIEPERHGLWIAATFVMALLALGLAVTSVVRANIVHNGTQMEVVILNQKIEALRKEMAKPAVADQQNSAAAK
jgi:Tfp pilus assembly protein PilN